jgi:integral membrane protein
MAESFGKPRTVAHFRSMITRYNLKEAEGKFLAIAFLEGISFLVLLGIGMPLKYLAGMPLIVKYVGWAHGLLFVMYMVFLLQVTLEKDWKWSKAGLAFVVSLLPFGTFWFEARHRRESMQ